MTATELCALAQIAIRCDYPGPRGERPPRWIVDLATDGTIPSDHDHDRLRHAILISWGTMGWKLTEKGWEALDAAKPRARAHRKES